MGYFEEQQSRRREYEERERQYAKRNWRIALTIYAGFFTVFFVGLGVAYWSVLSKYW